jgi:hypothetical protein
MENTTPTPKDTEATSERFQITDMQGVSWYLKKLLEKDTQAAALRAELATVTANYAAMLESIEQDRRGLEFLYATQVREVARTEAERLHRKSVTTPYGVLAFREQPGALQLKDRQTCADIALTLGMTTTSPDVSAYRRHAEAHFEKTGEALPGFEYKPSEEKFSIRQSKAKEPKEGGGEAQEAA